MSKKLILFLMLAVFGSTNLLKADEVTIGDPAGKDTDANLPVCSLAKYTLTQQIYTAEEIGRAGTINSFTMWLKNSSSYSRDVKIYMKNVNMDAFEFAGSWAQMSEADLVATGTIDSGVSSPEAVTFTLSTPFEYDGESNLVICFADVTGSWEYGVAGVTFQGEKYRAICYTSSDAIDITNIPASNVPLRKYRNVVSLDITPAPVPFDVTPTDFGPRPNNAWMEPVNFEVLGTGYNVTVMNIDNDYFTFDGHEVPFTTPATFAVTTGNADAGEVTGHVAFIYEGSRGNARFDIKATAYDPTEGDVVEKVKIVPAGFSTYTDQPSEIYHNYNLPGEDSDNPDAVYRLNFYNLPKDVLLKANIGGGDRGEGKVALYKEETDGTCHPMRDNAYEYAGMLGGKTLDGDGMYVEKGGIYYLVAQAENGFTVNINALNAPAPEQPVVTYPENNSSISPDNVTAKWDIKEFTTEIRVSRGTISPTKGIISWTTIQDWTPCITETDTLDNMQLQGLAEGSSYFLKVDARNAAGEVESEVVTFYTTASAPTNLSVSNDKIFEGDEVTFSWDYTTSSDVTGYNIYCDGSKLNTNAITTKNFYYTFEPGTYNMDPGYEITVKAVFSNGTESAASEPISVNVSGCTTEVSGTVYYDKDNPKPLAGATVTFTGKDEFGNDVTLTKESNGSGAYAFCKELKAGWYTATAELSGLSYSAKIEVPFEVEYTAGVYFIDFTANMALPAPENLTASNDKVFEGDEVTFSWDYTTTSDLFAGYYLYIDGTKINQAIQGESTSYLFNDYNMSGDGYEITVKAVYKNGEIEYESAASEPIYVKVSGYVANVSGTVYYDTNDPKPLAGATVTFTGKDEFGNDVTLTTESNENGAYAFNEGSGKRLKAGSYTTATAKLSSLYESEIPGSIDVVHCETIDGINFRADMVLPAPEDLTASNDEVFEGETVTFNWSFNPTPTSDLFAGYNFYIDGSMINQDPIQEESIPCRFDTYNMDPGHKITVKAVYKNGEIEYESAASEPIYVKVSGNGIVAGNVYDCNEGTPLEGVKLTLNGLDEFGDPVVLTTTTGDDGIFVSDIKAGTYAVRASLDGFEDVTWERPIRFTYQQETSLDNICMHEMYYAPSSVVAEEIDNQKVVKVEWDMNRSLQNFNIWIRKTAGENIEPGVPEKSLLEGNYSAVSSTWYDNLWETKDRGVYQYGVEALYGGTMGSGSGEAGELTVYDGDYNLNPNINPDEIGSTIPDNHYFPFYVLRANNYTKSNMIMPAADLADMKDCEITSMKFYYERPKNDARLCDTPWKVWLKEVSETEPSEPYDMSSVDPVYDNYIEFLNGKYELVITLSEPFEYHGGNLLIAVQNEVGEDYGVVAFAGNENRDNQCSACGYGETEDFDFNHTSKFLPKTTFSYRKHITWSNTLEKDMNKESFTFKVSTSDEGGSVDGARVTMTNVSEPWINKLVFSMEETGEYQIANFRRGVYNIEVEPADGDHDAFTEVNVNLWDASEYPVVLNETKLEVKNVYVSHTGFARWDKPTVKDRGFNGYALYVDDRQVEELFADTCYQIDCTELAIDSHKFTVGVVQNTGETKTDKEFEYLGCDNFNPELVGGYHTPQAVAECHDVVVTWGEEESSDLKYNFDDGTLQGWTAINAGWEATNQYEAHSGDYTASPTTVGAYLVSPLVALGEHAEISFYSKKTDQDVELSVLVSTGTDLIDLQSADELGLISVFWDDFICKSTLFLSDYAGQQVCLAFLNIIGGIIPIDDITITNASEVKQWDVTTWALYLDDEPLGNVSGDTRYYNLTIDDNEQHTFRVVGIDAEYNMSCGDEVTFTAGSTNTPSNLVAEEIEGGVRLTWKGYSDKYKVYKGFAEDNMILLGTVEDGATEFVDVQVLQGCYYGVSGLSDCGESDMITKEFGEPEAMYYTPEQDYFSATMDVTGYVSINNEDPLNSNLEIGAFITDGYGVRHCCGGARSLYYPAENHNIFQFKVHGNSKNDVITFELYDHATEKVIDTLVSKTTLNFEVGGIAGTIEDPSVFKFFSTKTHTVQLKGIGNWVSTYIELSGEEGLGIIEDGLGENAVEIKVDNKFTTYVEGYGWFGNLETAGSENMFIIRMKSSEDTDVAFTGMVADPAEHPITINKNWNRIGYISSKTMDVNTALGTLNSAEGDVIKSKDAFATYYEGDGWFPPTMTMEPGKGYMYHSESAESKTLVYPVAAPSRGENAEGSATVADSHWTVEPSRFAMNMNVTAAVSVDGSLVENGDIEVGAFCNGEVRGSARPVYVEPLDRYVIFLTVFGNEGDNITFRLFNPEDGSEYTAVEHLVYSDDAVKGGIKDPFMLNFGGDDNISVFPNPTKGNVIVSADGMKNISVVNTLGQTVYRQAANAGEMTIDMSQFGAGMYLINIETENGTTVKRVTVTR